MCFHLAAGHVAAPPVRRSRELPLPPPFTQPSHCTPCASLARPKPCDRTGQEPLTNLNHSLNSFSFSYEFKKLQARAAVESLLTLCRSQPEDARQGALRGAAPALQHDMARCRHAAARPRTELARVGASALGIHAHLVALVRMDRAHTRRNPAKSRSGNRDDGRARPRD